MMDPQNLYIAEGTRAEIEALRRKIAKDLVLLFTVLERLPKLVLSYIRVLDRRVNARTDSERDFIDYVYTQLKQGLIDIPRALETGANWWSVFVHYFIMVYFTDEVLHFFEQRKKKEGFRE
ncbi:hypothetical protein BZA05DRAFT_422984 [Tricharina praecox]|uniref:uncharacterized protein n=1 Tax=Tricharina praecox TaxID=43433 RepID=UPI00221E73E4|nr:uncharacterized protein BZA05DRAFT_422984 [Tricharina praecox]KAI5840943.1 hypothetical protein BZA05DRAFT_422984 [Tricharina praecox]